MTTQSNVSNPIEVAPARPFSWPLALAILVLGLILGVFAANLAAAVNKSDAAGVPQRVVRDFPARPNLLELERKTHIAAQANLQRARETETARYTSLGLFYAAGSEAKEQPATAAEAARYNGLAEFYAAGTEVKGQPATAVEAARYNGLAEFYGANVTPSPLNNALFAYHQSERGRISADSHTLAWPSRPTQFYPAQKTMAVLGEADPDGDIGLMELSTK
ncbi:MAG: hypothetical protein BroJett011_23320 [Chloroflexota bacterium]|nr:MAG: hypothetical protein BroJett011_23320 [Chloroflexota bacterium]